MIVLRALSALIFLIGALAMVLAGIAAWLYAVIALVEQFGPFVGFVAIGLSLWAFPRFEAWFRAPWLFWFTIWNYADGMILDRDR